MDRKIYVLFFLTTIFLIGSVSAFDWSDRMVAYWSFNDNTGSYVTDNSGHSNNGTMNGGAWVSGKLGSAVRYDGINDYSDFGEAKWDTVFQSNHSTSFWFNASDLQKINTDGYGVVSKWWDGSTRVWEVQLYTNDIRLAHSNNAGGTTEVLSGATNPSVNTWYHVVYTYDSATGNKTIYVNGAVKGSVILAQNSVNNAPLIIGGGSHSANPIGQNSPFNGTIDEVGIWNRTLSASEVLELYAGGSGLGYGVGTTVVLTSPDGAKSISNSMIFNSTGNISGGTFINATLTIYQGGSPYTTLTQVASGTNSNQIFTITNIPKNSYTWNVEFCATTGCASASSTKSFAIIGVQTNLTSPANNYLSASAITLNATITNSTATEGSTTNATFFVWNSTGAITNQTTQTISGLSSNPILTITPSIGTYTWNVLGCSTTGCSWASTNRTFTYGYQINSVTYNSSTSETSREGFILNISIADGAVLGNSYLNYGTSSNLVSSTTSGSNKILSNSIEIPVGSGTNSFSWNITLIDSLGTKTFQTSTYTQTVDPIYFGACNATYPNQAINFTIKDETTMTLINGSLQATFLNYYPSSGSGSVYKTAIFSNTSDLFTNYPFCIAPNITMKVTGIITYSKSGYDTRNYIFDATELNNNTQAVTLYLAPSAATDILTLTVVDQSNTPVENALVLVQKQNIGGSPDYITVNQFTTDSNGQGITDVILYTTYYRYLVYVDGSLVLTTTAAKESTTTKTLKVNLGTSANYNNFLGVNGTISFDNSSQIASFNYLDSSGELTNACIYAFLVNGSGYSEYSHSCSALSSGILTLTLNQNGTYLVEGLAYVDNGFYGIVDYDFVTINEVNPNDNIHTFGQVITIIAAIVVVTIGAAANSVLLGMGLLVAVMFFAWNLGFIAFNLYTTGGALIVLAIMIILIAYRRFFY